ncbi:MAG: hypothetical protein H6581_25595 [Bacteroidia bacterium]|nr:hypothetical protein [Bacteroidia bacterium]
MKKLLNDWRPWLFGALTLGLAPFAPEPHIWEKIRWLKEGGHDWEFIYIFDFVLHGLPWLLLLRALVVNALRKSKENSASTD